MKLRNVYCELSERLMARRDPVSGVWTGRLSSSALSTALAASALREGGGDDQELANAGVDWLVTTVNPDGGWGDTPESPSNLSTSLIARACVASHTDDTRNSAALSASAAWIMTKTGALSLPAVADTLRSVYGDDKTFAVPILMYLALCGDDESAWRKVPPLPFLMALLPGWCYRFFKLEVVSYALPALIAVGLCRHLRVAALRKKTAWAKVFAAPLLRKLACLQPEHGGFLDAAPLTAFVVLALKGCGYAEHAVVQRGCEFLRASIREDGSWPIDSNLRTWLSSLSARALAVPLVMAPDQAKQVADWLINVQGRTRHPYTGAAPGGWAWTDLPGGVPDADDTSAALIALFHLKDFSEDARLTAAVRLGLRWLMDLQNSDGGMPTFCRGWGKLPFDKSCCDITAHAIQAFALWIGAARQCQNSGLEGGFLVCLRGSMLKMLAFLERAQESDGAWLPLWFGHQQSQTKLNHIIGTARVVSGLRRLLDAAVEPDEAVRSRVAKIIRQGESLLVAQQKADGGWSAGDTSTIEETALAVTALSGGGGASAAAALKGAELLADLTLNKTIKATALGLYFSVLWYDEELYPLIWSVEALRSYAEYDGASVAVAQSAGA
ncbi:MAG: prenyltransferase/squalene oxidase repeat-containing protein [Kiritimatiellae bacterium]|nr:prenyltransferase/squalene oxidase repeat-containing protein [Kiritimatiellia bacterium]